MAQPYDPDAMDVSDGGYETDDTILVGDGDDGYTSDEIRQINQYYDDQMTLTPPRTNRQTNANANDNTPETPPTMLLTNNQMPRQVYKMVIQQDGTLRLVPFTTDDYRTEQQPFDESGRAINRDELSHIQPRRLFDDEKKGDEKEGGASKSRRRSKRRRTKKSLRKRRTSRKRRTARRRKTRSNK